MSYFEENLQTYTWALCGNFFTMA